MDKAIEEAAGILHRGGLVAVPTETVYGLAADATNPTAVSRIFAAKQRPATHPLIVHLPSADAVARWVSDPPAATAMLAAAFWPGPLTLILKKAAWVPEAVTGGLPTVGIRVPAHPRLQALLRRFGGGLAAPSANRFGHVSPTTAAHVRADLGDTVDMVLDGGGCEVGIESTIVDLSDGPPVILRPGAISQAELEAALGQAVPVKAGGPVKAPGQLESHYAPRARVEVVASDDITARVATLRGEGALVASVGWHDGATIVLPADDEGYARGLYGALREADEAAPDVILVVEPPAGPLRDAVLDRLQRACAPRPS